MPTIKISAAMPELPRNPPPIYKLSMWNRTRERELLNLWGKLKWEQRRTDVGSARLSLVVFSAGSNDLIIHRIAGAFRFRDRNRWMVDDGSDLKFSDEEAIGIGREYLDRYDLLPSESRFLRVSRLHVATGEINGKRGGDHRVIDAGVIFQRTIDGTPVYGQGGKVVVYLNHEGNMTCLDKIWRPLDSVYREVKELYPPQHAIDEATRLWKRQHVWKAEVKKVLFGYHELGWDERQRYMQPAFIVLATLTGPDERVKVNAFHVTAAAVNHMGRIIPPLKKMPPPKPRQEQERSSAARR